MIMITTINLLTHYQSDCANANTNSNG